MSYSMQSILATSKLYNSLMDLVTVLSPCLYFKITSSSSVFFTKYWSTILSFVFYADKLPRFKFLVQFVPLRNNPFFYDFTGRTLNFLISVVIFFNTKRKSFISLFFSLRKFSRTDYTISHKTSTGDLSLIHSSLSFVSTRLAFSFAFALGNSVFICSRIRSSRWIDNAIFAIRPSQYDNRRQQSVLASGK